MFSRTSRVNEEKKYVGKTQSIELSLITNTQHFSHNLAQISILKADKRTDIPLKTKLQTSQTSNINKK